MKQVTLLVMAIYLSLSADELKILTQEGIKTELEPDILIGSVGFEEQSKNSEEIRSHMASLVAEVKRFDPDARICRGGGYQISPRYSYKDHKQEFVGYHGSVHFTCEFEKIETYDAVMNRLDKGLSPSIIKRQEPLSWAVSDERKDESIGKMRHTLLQKALAEAKAFSASSHRICTLSSINYVEQNMIQPLYERAMVASSAPIPNESPISAPQSVSLSASLEYMCR